MKQKILVFMLCSALLTGCGTSSAPSAQTTQTAAVTTENTLPVTTSAPVTTAAPAETSALAVATGDDVIAYDEVGFVGMEEIPVSTVKDGEYPIGVDSSSSMFKIGYCLLKVSGGKAVAEMTINSKSYDYLFAGTAEEAARAESAQYITPQETDDGYRFTFPVEALDRKISCAAYSHKKQLWYDRTLVFRADSMDASALPQKEQVTVSTLGLADGDYTVNVKLEGGSGRASVQSPAKLTVKDGSAVAEIVWSSSNYDYMRIGETKYQPKEGAEFSTFEIPVSAFDTKLKIAADTTAMSTPHEIEYTLYFESASIKQ